MPKRILALDDDPDILDLYSLLFEAEGYEIKTLISGDSLSSAIDTFAPDLILLDIHLGTYNGLDLCKKLKTSPATEHIPVFIASADESIYNAVSAYGADAIIVKPFDINELLETADDTLSAKVISITRPLRPASAPFGY